MIGTITRHEGCSPDHFIVEDKNKMDEKKEKQVCVPLDLRNATRDPKKKDEINRQGTGIGQNGDPMTTLSTGAVPAIICVHGSQTPISNSDHANAVNRNNGLGNCVCQYGEVAGTLEARYDSSPCADRGQNIVCYENHAQDSRVKELTDGVFQQINAKAGMGGGNLPLVQHPALAIAENWINRKPENGPNGIGIQAESAYTQNATGTMGVCSNMTVRRLLPVETERLMAFPDNWTRIPWRGKPADQCPDGPRYKACGNSMCVNVMRWIGMRIELVERKIKREEVKK